MLTPEQWKKATINILRKVAKDEADPATRELAERIANDMEAEEGEDEAD